MSANAVAAKRQVPRARGGPRSWKTGFFFLYGCLWLGVLIWAALDFGSSSYTPTSTYGFTDVLPLWVPWAGALGGTAISLVGTAEHALDWDSAKFAYWHLCRPVLGAVFGGIGVLALVLVLQGVSPDSTGGEYTPKGTAVLAVIAFLLGYREQTFRELVTRLVDTLLKPAQSTDVQLVTLSPMKVDFGMQQVNQPATQTLTVVNRSTASLSILPAQVTFDNPDLTQGMSSALTIPPNADGAIPLTWQPTKTGALVAQASVTTGTSTLMATIVGQA